MKRIYFLLFSLLLMISSTVYSQEFPTRGEIYDFNVGDIFEFETHHTIENGFSGSYELYTIYDKYFSSAYDSVSYEMSYLLVLLDAFGNPTEALDLFDFETYTNLDEVLPADSANEDIDEYNGRLTTYITLQIDEWTTEVSHKTLGCGEVYKYSNSTHPDNPFFSERQLVYFKKGNEEWGTSNLIPLIGLSHHDEKQSIVFPNPASDHIKISTKENSEIQIFNSTGQLILSQNANTVNTQLDISAFPACVYFVNLLDSKGLILGKSKFLKR
jgi:hypothetical protein